MPKDQRRTVIAAYEAKITKNITALGFLKEIPLNTVIHVIRATLMTYENDQGKKEHCWVDAGHLLYPFSINSESFRCRVLGVEIASWDATTLLNHNKDSKFYLEVLRFLSIRSWKLFNKEDAGLYVNWAALSEDFKHMVFGK